MRRSHNGEAPGELARHHEKTGIESVTMPPTYPCFEKGARAVEEARAAAGVAEAGLQIV